MSFKRSLPGKFERARGGLEERVISVGNGFLENFAFESSRKRSRTFKFGGQKIHKLEVFALNLGSEVVEVFFFEFSF